MPASIYKLHRAIPTLVASTAFAFVAVPVSAADLSTLVTFNGTNGSYPTSALISDAAGNLYGTTRGGGAGNYGTAFEIAAGTHALTTLVAFDGSSAKGGDPAAGLTRDAAGNLYGTAYVGGPGGYGSVFRIDAGTNNLTTLASFDKANGAAPSGGVIRDSAGNLYGTTQGDGPGGYGTVFRIDAGTNAVKTLASFNADNGATPESRLIADKAGNLYGTTLSYGLKNGVYGQGTVFRIDAATNAFTTLVNFDGPNGGSPFAGLVADAAGNLYGATYAGGTGGGGTVFRIDAATDALTTLANFDNSTGTGLIGELLLDAAGNIFGTTSGHGPSFGGTIFRIDAGTDTLNTLVSFDGTNGARPSAALTADAAGNLYGTTYDGPTGLGTLFEVQGSGFVAGSAPPTASVPEPASWAMMVVGFGILGVTLRKRSPDMARSRPA